MLRLSDLRARVAARHRITKQERILFFNRLSVYLRSGVPLVIALSLVENSASRGARVLLAHAGNEVAKGTRLSEALTLPGSSFTSFEMHLVRMGEESGSLPESLAQAGALLSRRVTLLRKVRGMLIYPIFILIGAVGIVAFLLLYIFPKIVPLFEGLGASLPLSTRALMAISGFLGSYGLVLASGTLFIGLLVRQALRAPRLRRAWERILLGTPGIGPLLQSYEVSLLCNSLRAMLQSGISLVSALSLAESGTSREVYREALALIRLEIIEGERLSSGLARFPDLFPRPAIELISTGESIGTLPSLLDMAANLYEEEFEGKSRLLTSFLEPALMVFIGLVVGSIALAVISPIYKITDSFAGV